MEHAYDIKIQNRTVPDQVFMIERRWTRLAL